MLSEYRLHRLHLQVVKLRPSTLRLQPGSVDAAADPCFYRAGSCMLAQVHPQLTFQGWKQLNCKASEEENTCLRSANLIGKSLV